MLKVHYKITVQSPHFHMKNWDFWNNEHEDLIFSLQNLIEYMLLHIPLNLKFQKMFNVRKIFINFYLGKNGFLEKEISNNAYSCHISLIK